MAAAPRKTDLPRLAVAEVRRRAKAAGIANAQLIKACEFVLSKGMTRYAARKALGDTVDYAALHRAVRRLTGFCPTCGQPLPALRSTTSTRS